MVMQISKEWDSPVSYGRRTGICGLSCLPVILPQYQFRNRTSIPFSSFSALVKTFKSEFR